MFKFWMKIFKIALHVFRTFARQTVASFSPNFFVSRVLRSRKRPLIMFAVQREIKILLNLKRNICGKLEIFQIVCCKKNCRRLLSCVDIQANQKSSKICLCHRSMPILWRVSSEVNLPSDDVKHTCWHSLLDSTAVITFLEFSHFYFQKTKKSLC